MAGGGQAGELKEDKLDKGTRLLSSETISHAQGRCSG